jgi:hypothetical protein
MSRHFDIIIEPEASMHHMSGGNSGAEKVHMELTSGWLFDCAVRAYQRVLAKNDSGQVLMGQRPTSLSSRGFQLECIDFMLTQDDAKLGTFLHANRRGGRLTVELQLNMDV